MILFNDLVRPRVEGIPLCVGDKTLVFSAVFLLGWTFVTNAINHETFDSTVSALRILFEILVYLWLLGFEGAREIVKKIVIVVGSLNSLVIAGQLLESLGVFATHFNNIPYGLYGILNDETFRHSGFLNGFQISSLLSFLAIVVIAEKIRKETKFDYLCVGLILLNSLAVVCGARTFTIFLPLVFILNKKLLPIGIALTLSVAMLLFFGSPQNKYKQQIEDRIVPAYVTVLELNPRADYSFADTLTHYRSPKNTHELLMGNGEPRYPVSPGGGDPTISRWLFQSGLPAALAVLIIVGVLVFRITKNLRVNNLILAIPLLFSIFKGELVTSAGVLLFLLVIFSSPALNERTITEKILVS